MQHFTRLALTARHFRLRATHFARFGPTRPAARLLCLLAALVALALLGGRPACAQLVMNFDGQTISRNLAPSHFTQNGITLVASASNGVTLFNAGNPDPGYALDSSSGTATFTRAAGGAFTFSSIDVFTQFAVTVTFTGTLAAGGTVTDTFVTSDTFQTYHAPARFAGLSSVTLSVAGGAGVTAFDNVTFGTARQVPSRYLTIQAAIDAAQDGDTVAVAPGTYTGDGNRDLDFHGKAITVQGTGGARQTIINCQGTSSANHRGFVFQSGETSAAVVRGFTLRGGYEGAEGGAVQVVNGSDPTITDCVLTGNYAAFGGAVNLNRAAATVTRCAFLANSAGTGGAVQAVFSSTLVCTDSVFAGNSATVATSGVLIYESSTGTVTNCTFTGNVSASNGTLDVGNGDQDTATSSSGTVTNCILYGDTGGELSVDGVGTVSNNDIQGGFPGSGNISADPLFVSAAAPYDLHLQAGSPAIAIGTASAPDFPATDFDGKTWHNPPAAGAYEGTSATTSTGLKSSVNPSTVGQNVTFIATVANTSQGSSAIPTGTVTFSVDSGNVATVTLDGNGQATYSTSSLMAGSHTVTATFAANVRFQGSTSSPLIQSVVALPPAANPQTVSVAHDTAKGIILTGSDPNSPPRSLTYIVVSSPSHGTLSGTAPNLTYTPNAGYHGGDSFTFKVNNGVLDSNTATVTLNVATGTPKANPQSVSVAFNTAKGITLTGTDPDVPTLPLTYAVLTAPAHGTLSGTAPNLTYTPTAGYQGADSFTFRVNNGTNTSSTATVSLTITAGTPTASGQSVSVAFNTAKAVTLTGSDPDSPQLALTYTVVTGPAHGTLKGTAPNLTYTPTAGYFGPDSFTFTVSNGTNTSSAATVSLTVAAPGTPTANPQSVNTGQGSAVGVTLTGTDPDVPALTLTYSVVTGPAHGTLKGTAPNLTYTPTAGYFGPDSFTFTVSNGTNTSPQATVSLSVAQGAATDVTTQITLTRGGFRYVRATGHYLQPLTLTNTGAALPDPISLVLDNLAGATLVAASGTTSAAAPSGSPYVMLPQGGLAAGASVTLTLEFTAQPSGYSVRVLAGPGAR